MNLHVSKYVKYMYMHYILESYSFQSITCTKVSCKLLESFVNLCNI